MQQAGPKLIVDSSNGVGVAWQGEARVDGELWPAADADILWLPAGSHSIEAAPAAPRAGPRLLRLNGELKSARRSGAQRMEFAYQSASRALAVVDRQPKTLQVDGVPQPLEMAGPRTLFLPPGQHVVILTTE
jgi:hypothetical protein